MSDRMNGFVPETTSASQPFICVKTTKGGDYKSPVAIIKTAELEVLDTCKKIATFYGDLPTSLNAFGMIMTSMTKSQHNELSKICGFAPEYPEETEKQK